ncbi:MAG: hypothetical protein K5852_05175, partial [Eubacterium sp.]|nr:hypothetical protein [Eubacterium sp.]
LQIFIVVKSGFLHKSLPGMMILKNDKSLQPSAGRPAWRQDFWRCNHIIYDPYTARKRRGFLRTLFAKRKGKRLKTEL